jgi:hypothetical protein
MSFHVISCHFMSFHVISCHFMSFHVMSLMSSRFPDDQHRGSLAPRLLRQLASRSVGRNLPLFGLRDYGNHQGRTGRGIHGRTKVSCGPAMPNTYTPCGRATPQTALRPFGGWPARRAGGLRPSSSPLDTPSRTGLVTTFSISLLYFILPLI